MPALSEALMHSDAELAKVIADGKGTMPGFSGKLGADTISALVKHIRTLAN